MNEVAHAYDPVAAALARDLPRSDLLTVDRDIVGGASVDYRGWFRGSAIALARPRSVEEVQAVMRACHSHDVVVVPQGGNSSMCGGSVPAAGERPALILGLGGLNRIRSVNADAWSLIAEAGCTLGAVQEEARKAGRRFGLDFGARDSARLGGFIATNAGGSAVVRYGMTRDLVLGLEVVLPDGQLWSGLRTLRKDNSGFDLKQLFIGSEGTLGVVTAAALRLHAADTESGSALMALPSLEAANELAALVIECSAGRASSIELMPKMGIELACGHVTRSPSPIALDTEWYVLVRFEDRTPVDESLEMLAGEAFERGLCTDAVLSSSAAQEAKLWNIRDAFSEVHRHLGVSHRFDLSVPLGTISRLYLDLCDALGRAEPDFVPFGFGHLGDGNLHFSACQPPRMDPADYEKRKGAITDIVNGVAWRLGGSISAEHGIGQLHRHEMTGQKSPVELDLMRRIRSAIDPKNIMNPGVLLPDFNE